MQAKDAVGLPRRGDRKFYIDQLARKLRSGELGRNIRITAAGKTDGAGAQAQAVISAIVFADAFGLDYVHSPFRSIEHAEGPMDDWVSAWETTFNFGEGRQLLEVSGLPFMPLGDFLKHRSVWSKDFAAALRRVARLLQSRCEPFSIRVYSQGAPEEFGEFAALGAELCLDRPALWTFCELVEADVLIMAKSSFSYVAAILCDGVKIYEPQRERPLPQWVVRDEEGGFDEIELCRRLNLVLDAKCRSAEQGP